MADSIITIDEEKWTLMLKRINELKFFVETNEYGKKKSFYSVHQVYDKVSELQEIVKKLMLSIKINSGE
jgi:hypothetical protein